MARGRKVNSSGEKSRKLLLEKALELFSENGYHKTKISDIVKAANLTQPTFYLYFQNKESLFNDIKMQFSNSFLEILHRDLQTEKQNENFVDSLKQCTTNLFEYFSSNPNLTTIGFKSEESAKLKDRFSEILVEKLEVVKDRYDILDVDIRIFAESFVGSIERLTFSVLLTKVKQPEELATDVINIYFQKTCVL